MGVIGAQYRRVSGALSTCCRVPVMAAPVATMIWSDDGCEGISLMEDWDPVVKQMRYWFQMERRKGDVMTVPRLGGFPQVGNKFWRADLSTCSTSDLLLRRERWYPERSRRPCEQRVAESQGFGD